MAFRQTLVALKKFAPSSSAPSQVLLRLVEKLGNPTTEELWREASQDSTFNSKNHMKKILQFLRESDRIQTKPKDPSNHKINFFIKLGRRPDILRAEAQGNQ